MDFFFSPSSSRSNLLIIPIREWKKQKFSEKDLIFKDLEQFSSSFLEIFPINDGEEDLIFFENENAFTETLEELKINKTPWELLKTAKGVFLIRNTSLLVNVLCKDDILTDPLLNLQISRKLEFLLKLDEVEITLFLKKTPKESFKSLDASIKRAFFYPLLEKLM